jgi:hypothetical protein
MQARACLSPKTPPLSHPVAHREDIAATAQQAIVEHANQLTFVGGEPPIQRGVMGWGAGIGGRVVPSSSRLRARFKGA